MGKAVPTIGMGMEEAVPTTEMGNKWDEGMLDRSFGEQVIGAFTVG